MYRVIIADDEPVIRRGLRETIEWDALGLEIAGEAADGTEALELIREIRPEILITDIRMPEMDGIQLIREVRELEMNVKITILSGYSDYDYLKAAIRLGVDNYLLKPIDNDELIANLRNTVSEIEKEAAASLQIRQGTNLLRSNTLRRLVAGYISQEELREKAEFLHIPLDAAHYLCAVCSMSQQIPVERRNSSSGISLQKREMRGRWLSWTRTATWRCCWHLTTKRRTGAVCSRNWTRWRKERRGNRKFR